MSEIYKLIRRIWLFVGPPIGILALAKTFNLTISDLQRYILFIIPIIFTTNTIYLFIAVFSFYFLYVRIRHRNVLLSVLSTDIKLTINTSNGDQATFTCFQRIRAYHDDITGYHRFASVTPPGSIPRELIEFNISHCDHSEQQVHLDGDPTEWTIIHRFAPIPRNLLVLGLNTVTRTETIVHRDVYTDNSNWYELMIPENYRHRRITITIIFHHARPCTLDDCEAICISANGIANMRLEYVPPEPQGGPGIKLRVRNPVPGERYRITWEY